MFGTKSPYDQTNRPPVIFIGACIQGMSLKKAEFHCPWGECLRSRCLWPVVICRLEAGRPSVFHGPMRRNLPFWLLLIFCCCASAAAPNEYLVFIGTYTGAKSKGIYASRLNTKTG